MGDAFHGRNIECMIDVTPIECTVDESKKYGFWCLCTVLVSSFGARDFAESTNDPLRDREPEGVLNSVAQADNIRILIICWCERNNKITHKNHFFFKYRVNDVNEMSSGIFADNICCGVEKIHSWI